MRTACDVQNTGHDAGRFPARQLWQQPHVAAPGAVLHGGGLSLRRLRPQRQRRSGGRAGVAQQLKLYLVGTPGGIAATDHAPRSRNLLRLVIANSIVGVQTKITSR
jgi:hypothetical protein